MFMWAILDATYNVSLKSVHRFQRNFFLTVITIYGHGGHLGNVTWFIYTNFVSLFRRILHIKELNFALIGQAVSEKIKFYI